MDHSKIKNVYEKHGYLSIENINFYVFCISTQSCKDCQTVQTLYKTRINFRFLSYTFLNSGWTMKSNIFCLKCDLSYFKTYLYLLLQGFNKSEYQCVYMFHLPFRGSSISKQYESKQYSICRLVYILSRVYRMATCKYGYSRRAHLIGLLSVLITYVMLIAALIINKDDRCIIAGIWLLVIPNYIVF